MPLIGEFNVDNALTTLAVLLAAEVPLAAALQALERCVAAPGRMQTVQAAAAAPHATVIVDYAHTPDALAKALAAARGALPGPAARACSAAAATAMPSSGRSWAASP